MAERFQNVMTSQEHQTINNAVLSVYTELKEGDQVYLLLRFVMVIGKTFTAKTFLFMNWKITLQQKRFIYFR